MATYETIPDINDIPENKSIWACAYATTSYKDSMGLKQLPIKGEITHKYSKYHKYFAPYAKTKGKKFVDSKAVLADTRKYADTYGECVELYNRLVRKEMGWFFQRAEECKKDIIEI